MGFVDQEEDADHMVILHCAGAHGDAVPNLAEGSVLEAADLRRVDSSAGFESVR